jgi:hypothetical protein
MDKAGGWCRIHSQDASEGQYTAWIKPEAGVGFTRRMRAKAKYRLKQKAVIKLNAACGWQWKSSFCFLAEKIETNSRLHAPKILSINSD